MDAASSIARVRSIFRNLLCNYELFDDEKNLIHEIMPYIQKFKNSIKDFIERLDGPVSKTSCSLDVIDFFCILIAGIVFHGCSRSY